MVEFEWHSEADEDIYKSLSGLVRFNGGYFKSEKQAYFYRIERTETPEGRDGKEIIPARKEQYLGKYMIFVHYEHPNDPPHADNFVQDAFGVKNNSRMGQYTIIVQGTAYWAAGIKGRKPVGWAFVLDGEGVVRQYKIHFENQRDDRGRAIRGSGQINEKKTELLWEREIINGTLPIVKVTRLKPFIQDYDEYGYDDVLDWNAPPKSRGVDKEPVAYTDAMQQLGFVEIDMATWLARDKGCSKVLIAKIKERREKAIRVEDIEGKQYWLPVSQIDIKGE